MTLPAAMSLVVGAVSVVLAIVAIWLSKSSEQRSVKYYEDTVKVLGQIEKQVAVIKQTSDTTHEKLLGTVTELAKPEKETQEEMLMRALLPQFAANPEKFQRMMQQSQTDRGKGSGQRPRK